ncbi:MAG: hypothetical protein VYE30_10260 [Pseudomonadota bacterium]|nr:hypothetical protein [Pseudomonadota bacterium]
MNRIKVTFDTWIQLLGMLGVLGGLIFVGLEMQQSQRIAIAGQVQARNQGVMDFQVALLTAEDRVSRQTLSINFTETDPATLTEEQREIRRHALNWQTNSLQNAFQQYELGLLPEDVWQQVQGRIQNRWASCYIRETYSSVIPSFREYLESLPAECE